MLQNNINISQIDINEILEPTDQYNPGVIVHYMAALERAQVNGAAKACWDESTGVSQCWNDSLDGLLTPDTKQKRSSWFAYDLYAQMSGNLVWLAHSANVDGIATVDTLHNTSSILVGRQGTTTTPVTLVISNANQLSSMITNGIIGVTLQKIPDSEASALSQLPGGQTFTSQVNNNQILLTLSDLNPGEVYLITFSTPSL